jgi:hypothetical protein
LQAEDSQLRQLLKKAPFYNSSKAEGWIQFKMFAMFVNMLTEGSADEKSKTLFHILQQGSGGAEVISPQDKEFLAGVPMMIN